MRARGISGTRTTYEQFLLAQQVEEGKSPQTVSNYRIWLGPLLAWLGGRDPAEATADDVREYLAGVFREYPNQHTRFSRVKGLKVFFGWMARRGMVGVDPTKGISTPRLPEQVPYVLDSSQVDALRRACGPGFTGLRTRAMLEVAFDTGVRSGEMRHLLVSDVDWRERTLRVQGKARPGRPAPVRQVPFSVTVTRSLRRYVDARSRYPGDALFCDRRGLPLTRRNMGLVIERLRKRAGLQAARGSWHDLRHSFVTEMLRSGANEEHLRRMLGHKDRRMLARYGHLVTADLRREHDLHSPADRLLRGND